MISSEAQHHLTAAQGYAELGMYLDANEELENIAAEERHRHEVLILRVQIYHSLKKWDLMQVVAKRLTLEQPDNPQWSLSWAEATRQADSLDGARLILLEAVERHSAVASVHYNLACYECLLGDLEVAKARLQHAFKLDPSLRLRALEDEDLQALWNSLEV